MYGWDRSHCYSLNRVLIVLMVQIEILRPVKELEELHLSDHVQNVPGQHFWDWENVRQSSNEEAEALLRDVHSTHQALKEQIELYDKNVSSGSATYVW